MSQRQPSKPKNRSRSLNLFACLLAGFLLNGCSGEKAPTTIPFSGIVLYKGKALTQGQIVFQPVKKADGELQRPATGKIGENGAFEMGSFKAGDGVLPGEYQVGITSWKTDPSLEELEKGAKRISHIPERYTSPLTSNLTITIPHDATEPISKEFNLPD